MTSIPEEEPTAPAEETPGPGETIPVQPEPADEGEEDTGEDTEQAD